jgi:hypothetical protein
MVILGRRACMRKVIAGRKRRMHTCMDDVRVRVFAINCY